jgi:hypothetical protein
MRKVFTATHPAEAHLIRGWLANEGITAEVAGEELFQTRGGAPITPDTLPTVWVINDDDETRAKDLLASRSIEPSGSPALAAASWRCPKCGELIEPEFTACWNCGTERPDLA